MSSRPHRNSLKIQKRRTMVHCDFLNLNLIIFNYYPYNNKVVRNVLSEIHGSTNSYNRTI